LQDEQNIERYWGYSQLDRVTTDPVSSSANGHNIFSAHPPFNLIIHYGIQDSSLTPMTVTKNTGSASYQQADNLDRMLATDINERTVKINDQTSPMKIVIQNVHLTGLSAGIASGGEPLIENYSFIARDYYFTDATLENDPYRANKASVATNQTQTGGGNATSTNTLNVI